MTILYVGYKHSGCSNFGIGSDGIYERGYGARLGRIQHADYGHQSCTETYGDDQLLCPLQPEEASRLRRTVEGLSDPIAQSRVLSDALEKHGCHPYRRGHDATADELA